MDRLTIYRKENGLLVNSYNGEALVKEIVVEGKDPRKIGEAVLRALAPTRGPRKRSRKPAPPPKEA